MLIDFENHRVGLIGANGFIGSAILTSLQQSGIAPRVHCGPTETAPPFAGGGEYFSFDLADTKRVESWVSGLDVIIHAAGPPSVQRSFEMAEDYVRVHVQGTATLLGACRRAKVRRFVYISSAEVYGRPQANPVAETHGLQARSPYAASKIGAEKLVEAHVEGFGLQAVILRPFSIYGPHAHSDSLLSRVVATSKSGRIRVRDFRPIRDYCYVNDLATAVLGACCLGGAGLRVFNIGSGKGTSVADFARLVAEAMGIDIPIVEDRTDSRPGNSEIFELVADITAARDALGWIPETDLLRGLGLTLSAKSGEP
jgi:nucleoside-diphosphate-sugar epimerase